MRFPAERSPLEVASCLLLLARMKANTVRSAIVNEATATLEDSSAIAGATAAPRIYRGLNEEPGGLPPQKQRHIVGPLRLSAVLGAQSVEQTDAPGEATDQCKSRHEAVTPPIALIQPTNQVLNHNIFVLQENYVLAK
jgi:hypothetical protein